jgi:hypothetical protein
MTSAQCSRGELADGEQTNVRHAPCEDAKVESDLGFSVAELQRALAVAERMCSENLRRKMGPNEAQKHCPSRDSSSSPVFVRRFIGGANSPSFRKRDAAADSSTPGTPVLGSRSGSPAPDAYGATNLAGTVLKSGRYIPPKQLLLYVVR